MANITVKCTGGGGAGARRSSIGGGGGGGGGAYSESTFDETPGTYAVVVGLGGISISATPGGDSYYIDAATVMAKGGLTPAVNATLGVAGGDAASGVGDDKYSGGIGADGLTGTYGGGGGSGAGDTGNGNDGSTFNGGAAKATKGGAGGNGRQTTIGVGLPGSVAGGAGGGALKITSYYSGGAGAIGLVEVVWATADFGVCSVTGAGNAIVDAGGVSTASFIINGDLTLGAAGTNLQINIGDAWKAVPTMQINVGDAWKPVAGAKINIGDVWKTIF